jgi:hypothetical protein
MTNSLLIVIVIFMAGAFGPHIGTAFAMHDSNLDVNTWIASDNSTQLHTIDLNKGTPSPSAAAGSATTSEETMDESTEEDTLADENGDEATGSEGGGDEGGEGGGDEGGEGGGEDGNTIFENGDDD